MFNTELRAPLAISCRDKDPVKPLYVQKLPIKVSSQVRISLIVSLIVTFSVRVGTK